MSSFPLPNSTKNSFQKTRIVFFGTPEFSATILQALVDAHYDVVTVVTRADAVVGRKKEIIFSPVKKTAQKNSIPVLQPKRLKEEFFVEMKKCQPDLIITAAYGKIFPKELLILPPYGCLNIHASLLPRYRGASPVQNAILNGDTETGISLMRMNKGLDTGPVYEKKILVLRPHECFPEVLKNLSHVASELLLKVLPRILDKTIDPISQKEENATYCQLIEKEDGRIFWNEPAQKIINKYRAFFPWPGIFTYWKKNDIPVRLKILRIDTLVHKDTPDIFPGTVFLSEKKVLVKTSKGAIAFLEIQLEGKKAISAQDFIRGYADFIGSVLQ